MRMLSSTLRGDLLLVAIEAGDGFEEAGSASGPRLVLVEE